VTNPRARSAGQPLRVGVFGILGSGNIGNDASLESILAFLRSSYPGAVVDAMCSDPEPVRARHGLAAIPVNWYQQVSGKRLARSRTAGALKAAGKLVDVFRTMAWVGRHDVVIVPGMGVLEATLPLRAMGFPYALFLACAAGRFRGTLVALVCIGADTVTRPLTRGLLEGAARMAGYRSYRDNHSLTVMRQRGVGGPRDRVFADLAFALPLPPPGTAEPLTVGVGVMDYHGSDDDRDRGEEIYRGYLDAIIGFVRWLLDTGRTVRLFVGDANGSDDAAVSAILAAVRADAGALPDGRLSAEPVTTMADLARAMGPVGAVVATRYHNVICALMLGKPTISVGYSPKFDAVMADAGLGDCCLSALDVDATVLIKKFEELEGQAEAARAGIARGNQLQAQRLAEQFRELSDEISGRLAGRPAASPAAGRHG
jgi:polysaccharide pyruvyl transferase WcaK-like protein